MEKQIRCSRRNFLSSVSGLVIGTGFVSLSASPLDKQKVIAIYDEFSEEEEKIIKASVMANDILNYPEQGFSCASSILSASLKFLGQSQEISSTAASFGGGIGRKDLCGLLTGGHMAIGIASGIIHKDIKPKQKYAREISNQYWDWWESWAPIHCYVLKPRYDREGYSRMIQRVAAKVEELLGPTLQS